MINKKILIIVLIIGGLVFACKRTPSFKVSGEVSGVDGVVCLIHKVDGKWVTKDSAELLAGKFLFKGSVKNPHLCILRFKNNEKLSCSFIIENSNIHVKIDNENPLINKITGSSENDIWLRYKEKKELYASKGMEMVEEYKQAEKAGNTEKMQEIFKEYNDNVREEISRFTTNYIKINNKSYAAALIVSHQKTRDPDKIDELLSLLDSSLMECDLVIRMKERVNDLRKIAIGRAAPDFTMNDTKGTPITLSSLYGKGHILIDFWASWCGPCRAENPNLIAAYKKYHDKGFEILAVSYDQNKEKWLKAIQDDHLPWLHVSDLKGWESLSAKLYGISSVPSNVLLDKNGIVVAKNLRGVALEEKLEELIK